ncbi:nucleolar transcription factor 1-B-like [Embiotoca jacksoni]|uniref:nucleolar transcription factor 1-B-like n=1 Tax=Embiotoca jacksoni TaxID=100190 RepID=UPI00370466F5
MSQVEMETESGWKKEHLQKLLAAMKASIPQQNSMCSYTKALKAVDWDIVAFPPFSPEACQQKWTQILQKMRKIRTLPELIVEAEDVISHPDHNIKIHPELPKKPSPSSAIFYKENWAKFHKKHPDFSFSELFGYSIKKFAMLSDKNKAKYVEKFNLASQKYKTNMVEFRKQYSNDVSKTKKKKKKASDDKECSGDAQGLPPKPPLNGYNLFCKEQLKSMADISNTSYMSVWSQRWRELSEPQKAEYKTRYTEMKIEYVSKLKNYLERFDVQKQQQIISENDLKMSDIQRTRKWVKKPPGEPMMPTQSGHAIFTTTQLAHLKDKMPKGRTCLREINKMWYDLSYNEMEYYNEIGRKRIKQYSADLQKWFKTLTAEEQKCYQTHNHKKLFYLNSKNTKVEEKKELSLLQPSDSEDEDIEDSSSDEEEDNSDCYSDEKEGEDDDVMFEFD